MAGAGLPQGKDYDLTIVSHTEPMDIGIYARDDYYFNYTRCRAFNDVIKAKIDATADPTKQNATLLMAEAQRMRRGRCRERVPVPAREARRVWNAKAGRSLGKQPDPGQRSDGGPL